MKTKLRDKSTEAFGVLKNTWKKGTAGKIAVIVIGALFWPFILLIFSTTLYYKFDKPLKRWTVIGLLLVSTLPLTAGWVSGITSGFYDDSEKIPKAIHEEKKEIVQTQKQVSPSKPPSLAPTTEHASEPAENPTPSLTPALSPTTVQNSTQSKQVTFSKFKNFFIKYFDYGKFSKVFTTSDGWDFWEGDNLNGDKLVLGAVGENLKSGVLKAGPEGTSSFQVVTFFQMGHPPLINSGWVENTTAEIEPGGDALETTFQGIKATMALTEERIWIVSFTEMSL